MRSSTRRALFTLATGPWIISCAMVFLSVLVAPPARGQAPESGDWSPRPGPRIVESAGEVVMKFTRFYPGRTVYYTTDGDWECSPAQDLARPWDVSPPDCRRPTARAGEDYVKVRGEWIFTEAGSRTIRIPILDDDLDEADEETFMIHASQYDDAGERIGGYAVSIRIVDDDPKSTSDSSTSPSRSSQQSAGPQTGPSARTLPPRSTLPSPTGSEISVSEFDLVNQSDVASSEPGDGEGEVRRLVAEARNSKQPSPSILAALVTLLLASVAASGSRLKKRFGRRVR